MKQHLLFCIFLINGIFQVSAQPCFKLGEFADDLDQTTNAEFKALISGSESEQYIAAWQVFKNGDLPLEIRTSSEWLNLLKTDLANSKYGLKDIFEQYPEDINIWKQLKDDPGYSWELRNTNPKWEQWSQREFFKDITQKGKNFETNVCLVAFKDRNSVHYFELKAKFQNDFGKNLDDYDLFSQVQLKYNSDDYFIADQIFVKRVTIGGQSVVEDILIIENKLSANTPLTTQQNNAFTKNSFTVRSQNSISEFGSGYSLVSGDVIEFANLKQWYKVHDGSEGEAISGIVKM